MYDSSKATPTNETAVYCRVTVDFHGIHSERYLDLYFYMTMSESGRDVCVRAHTCESVSVCVRIHVSLFQCVCARIRVSLFQSVCACESVSVCVCVYMEVCFSVCVY